MHQSAKDRFEGQGIPLPKIDLLQIGAIKENINNKAYNASKKGAFMETYAATVYVISEEILRILDVL